MIGSIQELTNSRGAFGRDTSMSLPEVPFYFG